MSRFMKMLEYVEGKPEIVISFILALALVSFGLYIGGPWYVPVSTSVFGSEVHPELIRVLSAVFYLAPASVNIYGITQDKRRWMSLGAFGMFLAYLFAALIRILTIGLTPVLWIYPLALSLVAGILYIAFTRTKTVVKQ